jgi:hypothetical protein
MLYDTLLEYYKRLSITGYIPDRKVLEILASVFLTEISDLCSTEERPVINKALKALQDGCLIGYDV